MWRCCKRNKRRKSERDGSKVEETDREVERGEDGRGGTQSLQKKIIDNWLQMTLTGFTIKVHELVWGWEGKTKIQRKNIQQFSHAIQQKNRLWSIIVSQNQINVIHLPVVYVCGCILMKSSLFVWVFNLNHSKTQQVNSK